MSRTVITAARTALGRRRLAFRPFTSAIRGDGTAGMVDLPDLSICENAAYSIAFWANCYSKTTISNFYVAVCEGNIAVGQQNFQIYFDDSFSGQGRRRVRWRMQDTVNTIVNAAPTDTGKIQQGWQHVVCVKESSTSHKIYINGTLESTTTGTVSFTNVSVTRLLSSNNGGAGTQFGKLDMNEVLFYNVALDLTQVQDLYFDDKIPTTGLVAKYMCTDGSGTTVTESVSGQNGTFTSPSWTTGTNFQVRPILGVVRTVAT